MPFLDEQLQYLYSLQEWRSPIVDGIFRCLNFFDTDYFISSLVVFIWLGFSWRWGARLGFLMVASGWINALAKMAVAWPRPFFFDPDLAIVRLHDYGFPSGGAQTAMLLGCLLIYFWKSRWAWPIAVAYIAIISFSRVFLGVHFPFDIVGGWILGVALFYAYILWGHHIEKWTSEHRRSAPLAICIVACIVALSFRDYKTIFLMSSLIPLCVGISISIEKDWYFTPPQELWKKIGLGLFGIFSAAALALLARSLPLPLFLSIALQVLVSGFWVSLFASPFCQKVFLKKRNIR